MSFIEAVTAVFSKYATFSGRAMRSEYWYFALFLLIGGIATAVIDIGVFQFRDSGPTNLIFTLATLVPSIAVSVRRMHDIGRSGWYLLLILIPLIGAIIIIYWFCQKGEDATNAFGPPVLPSDGISA